MRALVFAALCTLLTPTGAAAEPIPHALSESLKPRPEWYGWQTLAVDGAAVAVPLLLAASNQSAMAGLSFGAIYVFGVPTIHWAHEKVGTGFGSLGLRVGLPIVGALLGCVALCGGGRGDYDGAALGALAGYAGAVTLDAAVFAYEEPEEVVVRRHASWLPTVAVQRSGATFGFVSEF